MEIDKLIGFLLPPLIDLINRKFTDSDVRFWVSVVFCSIIGTILSYINFGGWAPINDIINTIFVVFGTAQISYKAVYSDSKLQTTIRSGEAAGEPGSRG